MACSVWGWSSSGVAWWSSWRRMQRRDCKIAVRRLASHILALFVCVSAVTEDPAGPYGVDVLVTTLAGDNSSVGHQDGIGSRANFNFPQVMKCLYGSALLSEVACLPPRAEARSQTPHAHRGALSLQAGIMCTLQTHRSLLSPVRRALFCLVFLSFYASLYCLNLT